jgi:hypothetical protein
MNFSHVHYSHVVVRPRDSSDVSIPDWVRGGTLSPIIDDPAMA